MVKEREKKTISKIGTNGEHELKTRLVILKIYTKKRKNKRKKKSTKIQFSTELPLTRLTSARFSTVSFEILKNIL